MSWTVHGSNALWKPCIAIFWLWRHYIHVCQQWQPAIGAEYGLSCCATSKKKHAHIDDMHRESDLYLSKDRGGHHFNLLRHENIYSDGVHSLTKFLKPACIICGRRTRGTVSYNMYISDINITEARCSFAYRGPVHWNKLPPEVKVTNNFNYFKTARAKRANESLDNHPT